MDRSPFGSWRSPIGSEMLVQGAVGLSQLALTADASAVLWCESRPLEAGRVALMRKSLGDRSGGANDDPNSDPEELIVAPWSVRTAVHEYGGRCYTLVGDSVVFSHWGDQRLWRLAPDGRIDALTDEAVPAGSVRFADPVATPDGSWVVAVRETHDARGVVNDLVAVPVPASPGVAEVPGAIVELASGHDFYSAPRVSPDGHSLAWVCWDHPAMPWDRTELWVAELGVAGLGPGPLGLSLSDLRKVAGEGESISQPRWSPASVLHYVSDRTGWWNLYSEDAGPLAPDQADYTGPDWVFGQSSYGFAADGRVIAVRWSGGFEELGVLADGRFRALPIASGFSSFDSLCVTSTASGGDVVLAVAASPTSGAAVVALDPEVGRVRVLRRSHTLELDGDDVSEPEPIVFPTGEAGSEQVAHGLLYRPRNRMFRAPDGELPPLIVVIHGGPTAAARPVLNLALQFWTTRGFAVVDVNYRGSTGYGRAYRHLLDGQWGIADVDDCVAAARYLAEHGEVDGERMAIRGGSAGGFTTLAALAFHDVFAAGASLYGVADLELLARETHKFESRYLDGMVGPYPERRDLYVARSPIHHTEGLSRPIILFQGLEDKVVPPSQSEAMAAALRAKGVAFAYLTFEGEQHGFRRAETVRRVAEAELYFYGRVLGFTPADDIEPVAIENDSALQRSG